MKCWWNVGGRAPTASFPSNLSTSQHKRRRRLRLNAEITKQLNFVIRYSIIHVFKIKLTDFFTKKFCTKLIIEQFVAFLMQMLAVEKSTQVRGFRNGTFSSSPQAGFRSLIKPMTFFCYCFQLKQQLAFWLFLCK